MSDTDSSDSSGHNALSKELKKKDHKDSHKSHSKKHSKHSHEDKEHKEKSKHSSKDGKNAMERLEQASKVDRSEKDKKPSESKKRHWEKEEETQHRSTSSSVTSHGRGDDGGDKKKDREWSGSKHNDRERSDTKNRRRNYDDEKGEQDDNDKSNKSSRPSWENSKVRRHADLIHQRKLLWGSKKEEGEPTNANEQQKQQQPAQSGSKKLESSWTSAFVAASTDTNQLDKFQRLMGMKKSVGPTAQTKEEVEKAETKPSGSNVSLDPKKVEAEKKRQREMTEKLDQQYALARATTHMARGRGLGFM